MTIHRRDVLAGMTGVAVTGFAASRETAVRAQNRGPGRRVRKIATEEACCIPEIAERYAQLSRSVWENLDFKLVGGIYDAPRSAPSPLLPQLLDIDAGRLAVMDANNVDVHLLSQTAPGVQLFDAD